MAQHQKHVWLIAYDISDPKRLQRIHRFVRSESIQLQYSLYLTTQTQAKINLIKKKLENLIDQKKDDVRIYRLPDDVDVVQFGFSILPAGLFVFNNQLEPWLANG